MSARRVDTTEAWIWSCFTLRTGASPSISSKKMIEGCTEGPPGSQAQEETDTHALIIPTTTHAGPVSA